jgi:putative aldouronate transport system permease protein
MFGVIIAFKNFKFHGSNFFSSLFQSEWVGFKNFEFLFKTADAFVITRNTLLYNAAFIIIGLVISVGVAVMLSEVRSKKLAKFYQSSFFMPYFLSWVVVSYIAFAFLSMENGFINRTVLPALGMDPIPWYSEPKYWPFILIILNAWKWCGYNCLIYLASIIGIDREYYEAAMIDGASKWQQITKITIPLLMPVIVMMTLLNIGRIFNADFGLFFQVPRNTGTLFPATNVVDTYVYNSLMYMGDIGMSSAAALYQSVVGFILVLITNRMVKRINKDYALF